MRFVTIILIFLFSTVVLKGQNKEDTIKYMTSYSLNYLNTIFNTHNIDSAAVLWDKSFIDYLQGGYMECNTSYQKSTQTEIIKEYKKDLVGFKELPTKVEFKVDNANIMNIDDSGKLFFIDFTITNFNPTDSLLSKVSLIFGSDDNGKTWSISRDDWAYYFVYYLCRYHHKNFR